MRFLTCALIVLGSLGLVALSDPAPEAVSTATAIDAEEFRVDPVHSTVLFKSLHNNASYFYARFTDVSGSFTFDETKPSASKVRIEVKAESVDTRTAKLDQHLRSPDFFDAKQFPVITFESTKVKKGKKGLYEVTGDLSLHGVTKSITVEMEHIGTAEMRGGKVIGFHTVFTIDRTEFGMNYGISMLGSDIELIIGIEAGRS